MIRLYHVIRYLWLGLLVFCVSVVSASAGTAAQVVEALARPAVLARNPEKAVLLGAALAGSRIVAAGERGLVILSDDAGRTWRQAPVPVSVTLTAVRFADDRHGMAVGHGGAVLSSSDAGQSWVLQLDGRRAAQLALEAAQAGQNSQSLSDAELLVAEGPDKPFLDLLMFDKQNVLVVGAYGLAFVTSDGGQSWRCWMDRMDNPQGLHYYAVRMRGDVIVIAGEQGLVMRSGDAGKSFQRIETPYQGSFFTVELPSDNEIVLAGLRGNYWRSQDDGLTWKQASPSVPASIMGSALLSNGTLLMVDQAGFIRKSSGDQPPAPINATPLPSLNGLLHLGNDHVLALSFLGVMPLDLKKLAKEKSP